ncbi:putative mucin TcMUCII [Trypanosoma cruzi]|nr:putative mucin TcMUCII [Trypanosoma cruzi]
MGPLRNAEILREMQGIRPVRIRNQVVRIIRYKEKVRKTRQGQKVARVHLQNKQIGMSTIIPRRPLRRPQQRHQPRPILQQRHQVLRLLRRQLCRPPAHRHVLAKSTAASAALRGCVPRWCSPHPRWRTPLWAEEVCAGCACQHSTAGFVRVCCGSLYKIRGNNDCVLLHLLLLPCCVLRVVPRIRHVERIADTLICMRTGALGLFSFLIIVFYCFLNLWFAVWCASSAIALIPSVSWCVRCCWAAAICCCAWCSGRVYLFAFHSVDVVLLLLKATRK